MYITCAARTACLVWDRKERIRDGGSDIEKRKSKGRSGKHVVAQLAQLKGTNRNRRKGACCCRVMRLARRCYPLEEIGVKSEDRWKVVAIEGKEKVRVHAFFILHRLSEVVTGCVVDMDTVQYRTV